MNNAKNKLQKSSNKPPIKRKTAIILSIAGALIIAATVFAVYQRNNIAAVQYGLTYTQEELSEKIDANDKKISAVLENAFPVKVRDLTAEEKASLAANEITMEQAINLLADNSKNDAAGLPAGDSASSIPSAAAGGTAVAYADADNETEARAINDRSNDDDIESDDSDSNSAENGDVKNNDAEARLAELIAEAYVLRAYYTNSLEAMKASAIAEYKALNEEDRTRTAKMNIGMNYINLAGALEGECDRLMDDLITKISSELDQIGGDKSVIGEIKNCYAEEKSLKKAYYLSLYS